MEKEQVRAFIKLKYLEGKKAKAIHEELQITLGTSAPAFCTVTRWINEFRWGRQSVKDEYRPGRPISATSEENIQKVAEAVKFNGRISTRNLANELGIDQKSVRNILHFKLGLKKIQSQWVPKLLTKNQKQERLQSCQTNLALIEEDEELFLSQIITQDESWVLHYKPITRQESRVWLAPGNARPKVIKSMPSPGKVMASVWWDTEGILLTKFYKMGESLTGEVHASQLHELRKIIKTKRRGKLTNGVLLLQDNAPSHRSHVAMDAAKDCGFKILPHPAYSPDLAPSDYFLFPWLKSKVRGISYSSDSKVEDAVNSLFEECSSGFFLKGLKMLKERYQKCIDVQGDYFDE